MMIYRALKKFIKENTQSNNKAVFDLISLDIKSKIMFVVGDNASNTATFLTSIMNVKFHILIISIIKILI